MGHDDLVAITELATELLRHRYGAMPPTSAPECNGQVRLPFARIVRKREVEQRPKVPKKRLCFRRFHHVRRDLGVHARLRAKCLDEVRVR